MRRGVLLVCEGAPVEAVLIVTCACGLQWRGTEAELVPLVQQHGREVHNMESTVQQVMAMAVPADTPSEATA
jgi:hypothetical protein